MRDMRRMRMGIGFMVLILMVAVMAAGCASWRKTELASYESLGVGLRGYYDVARPACEKGQIPADTCVQLKDIYNKAKAAYILAGNTLVTIDATVDAAQKQALTEMYTSLVGQYEDLANQFIALWKTIKTAPAAPATAPVAPVK